MSFERIVTFEPAYDKRHADPSKNYGIHGVTLRMVLKGPLGATQFVLYTNWQLPHVQKELEPKRGDHLLCRPWPADKGYHWHAPQYKGQDTMKCDLMPSGECYYDGSGLNAEELYEVLLKEGSEGVWRELEAYYNYLAERKEEAA